MNHTVSVIIPCLNEKRYISACLDSIFNTDYPAHLLEVILVDNGSKDGTLSIARSYEVKILQDTAANVSGLRNLGAAHATGEILAFVDADCIVAPDWLKEAGRYFDRKEVVMWGAPPVIPENATWVQKTWYLVRRKKADIGETDWLESMNMFVRKQMFLKEGGFTETLKTAEDVDLSYRLGKKGAIFTDSRVRVVHSGEAADIPSFIRKEIWRGSTSYSGIKSHGISVKELPSLGIPFFYGILFPLLLIWAIITKSMLVTGGFVLVYLAPVFAVMGKTLVKRPQTGITGWFQLFFLVQIYFFSRTLSLIKTK